MTTIDELTEVCQTCLDAEDAVDAAEAALEQAKQEYNRIRMEVLPEMFQEVELEMLKMKDGRTIEIAKHVDGTIVKGMEDRAHAWLRAHDYGGIIKTAVVVPFGKGDDEAAAAFADGIREEHAGVTSGSSIHPQTLKSFIKERMEEGTALPPELFNVNPFNIAKIVRKKK